VGDLDGMERTTAAKMSRPTGDGSREAFDFFLLDTPTAATSQLATTQPALNGGMDGWPSPAGLSKSIDPTVKQSIRNARQLGEHGFAPSLSLCDTALGPYAARS